MPAGLVSSAPGNERKNTEPDQSDWSLLARVVQKDEAALAALYDRYSGLVYSEASRILRDKGAAEEILQDIFYQVWRTAEKFDPQRLVTRMAGGGCAQSRYFQVASPQYQQRR